MHALPGSGQARAAGQPRGVTRTRDVIDASVGLLAREHGLPVVTFDLDDLTRLDPGIELVRVKTSPQVFSENGVKSVSLS